MGLAVAMSDAAAEALSVAAREESAELELETVREAAAVLAGETLADAVAEAHAELVAMALGQGSGVVPKVPVGRALLVERAVAALVIESALVCDASGEAEGLPLRELLALCALESEADTELSADATSRPIVAVAALEARAERLLVALAERDSCHVAATSALC